MAAGGRSLDELWAKLDRLSENGCAQRHNDVFRMGQIEEWLRSIEAKLDRIFYGTLTVAFAIILFTLGVVGFLVKYTLFPA